MTPWYLSTKESWKQPVKNSAVLLNHQNMQHASTNPIKSPGPLLTSCLQQNNYVHAKDKVSQPTSTCQIHLPQSHPFLSGSPELDCLAARELQSVKQIWQTTLGCNASSWLSEMTPWYLSTKGVLSWKQPLDPLRLIVQSLYPIIFPVISLKSMPPCHRPSRLAASHFFLPPSMAAKARWRPVVLVCWPRTRMPGTAEPLFSHGCRNKTRSKYVQMLFERMEKCPKADLKLGFLNSSPILC